MAFFAIAEVWLLKSESSSGSVLLIFYLAGSPVLKEKMEMFASSNLKKKKLKKNVAYVCGYLQGKKDTRYWS